MKKITILAMLAMLSGCAAFTPPEDWSSGDRALQIGLYGAIAADAITTSRINTAYPAAWEKNPVTASVIGEDPSDGDVAAYFLGIALLDNFIAKKLPPKWRRIFQSAAITMHAAYAADNCRRELC